MSSLESKQNMKDFYIFWVETYGFMLFFTRFIPRPLEAKDLPFSLSAKNLRMHFLHELANTFVCFTLAP